VIPFFGFSLQRACFVRHFDIILLSFSSHRYFFYSTTPFGAASNT